MPKRYEMRMPDDTDYQIEQIRKRFGLKSDAAAVVFAIHALCIQFELPVTTKAKSEPGKIYEAATNKYLAARADRAKAVAGVRVCPHCDENPCKCERFE